MASKCRNLTTLIRRRRSGIAGAGLGLYTRLISHLLHSYIMNYSYLNSLQLKVIRVFRISTGVKYRTQQFANIVSLRR